MDDQLTPAMLTAARAVISTSALAIAAGTARWKGGDAASSAAAGASATEETPERPSSAALWAAGVEIGLWNFLGTACQAEGLETTGATKAAFLAQVGRHRRRCWRLSLPQR